MFQLKSLIAPALLALALILGACIVQPAAPPSSVAALGPTKAATQPVPDSLSAIEADAEDVMDSVPTGNWQQIDKDASHMAAAWQDYLPQAGKDGAPADVQTAMQAALARLQTAVKAQATDATLQAANDISAAVVELFAIYKSDVPADIGRLDVLGRQLILDVTAGNWTKAAQTLDQTGAVWSKVKPSALAHKGERAATLYDASLAAQADWLKAKNAEKLTAEAQNGLELVDALEQVYQ